MKSNQSIERFKVTKYKGRNRPVRALCRDLKLSLELGMDHFWIGGEKVRWFNVMGFIEGKCALAGVSVT